MFSKPRKHISSGVVENADESISAIHFCITPKEYLPHYSYIFRKPDPLGTVIKNVACYRLGTMLYLGIQKGKDSMKSSKFQQEIGGTSVCTKRLITDKKGYVELTSNDT